MTTIVRQAYVTLSTRLGAILSTHGIEEAVVVHMNSEGAALRRWREEVSAGTHIRILGTMPEEEVRLLMHQSAQLDYASDLHRRESRTLETCVRICSTLSRTVLLLARQLLHHRENV